MIKSMTAYGRGEYEGGDRLFIAEIKSVNNRYRDVVLRIPKTLQVFEDEIRSRIASRIRRGRIEVFIQVEKNGGEPEYEMGLNRPLLRAYLRVFEQMGAEFGIAQDMGAGQLCQMKDVIIIKPEEMDMDEVRSGLHQVLERALNSFDAMRIQEGRAIEEDFLGRIRHMKEYLDRIEEMAPIVVEEYRKRLRKRVNGMLDDFEMDENRLIQEVAIFADKCDITEEIVRGRSHLKQFRQYMSLDDAIGRRLDFLIQELNREVNTLGSKALDSFISSRVVEMKAELEKVREQVQNVE